ncbi:MAG TPA: hypothetical protein VNI84_01345 [Pyrinomonadaceae bacterium]|nr:hypothetical protein [Pyrinomonadaceae bacterium]
MGKKKDRLYTQLLAAITKMQNPESNPAQNYLTQESMAGAEFLKKGDFAQLPKGMFFDFQMPGEQLKQYKNLKDVGSEGTFALGADGGGAHENAKNYLTDKFARDAAQNYQTNISGAASNIRGGLGQAAGAKGATDANVIGALQGLYSSMPKGGGLMSVLGPLMGMGGQLGAAAITKGI